MATEYLLGTDMPEVVEPKRVVISAASSGANTLVAAVTNKKIRVISYEYSVSAAVNVKFQSSTTSDLTGLQYNGSTGQGRTCPFHPMGWFETVAGEALTANLSGATAIGGSIVYLELGSG